MNILTCPVCGEKLNIDGKAFKCANSHSFDIAKQGYVNLLLTNKSGDKKGDSRESAHYKNGNFAKGYYSFCVIMLLQSLAVQCLIFAAVRGIMMNIRANFMALI